MRAACVHGIFHYLISRSAGGTITRSRDDAFCHALCKFKYTTETVTKSFVDLFDAVLDLAVAELPNL
jgi:hypothetical protein